MARLAATTVAELDAELAELSTRIATTDGIGAQRAELRAAHELLLRATPAAARPPLGALGTLARAIEPLPPRVIDGLAPRPRTVFRLLQAGVPAAAWEVVADNATGMVTTTFGAATSSGAARTDWRLPLLTRIEPPAVFAWLPGFRDPRFGAPDECYDITPLIRPAFALDEAWRDGSRLHLAGSMSLEHLDTSPAETVQLVATAGDRELVVPAVRMRRPDLVRGTGSALTRLAWAGWSATVDLRDRRLGGGEWALSVVLEHDGIRRTSAVAVARTELTRPDVHGLRVGLRRRVTLDPAEKGWRLLVS
ncbi:MAG TPA: hypothetical protein VG708_06635 [Mycobacteriales bacterium]|nr:hypothetical protein [Mycobacteriales bacterium]